MFPTTVAGEARAGLTLMLSPKPVTPQSPAIKEWGVGTRKEETIRPCKGFFKKNPVYHTVKRKHNTTFVF